jgi:hypothetical protein
MDPYSQDKMKMIYTTFINEWTITLGLFAQLWLVFQFIVITSRGGLLRSPPAAPNYYYWRILDNIAMYTSARTRFHIQNLIVKLCVLYSYYYFRVY